MKETVIRLVAECSPYVELPDINEDTKILDDLEYDSLSIISLFEEIEETLGVNCMNYADMYRALQTVGDLIKFVTEKRGVQ